MNYIIHTKIQDWGESLYFMEESGKAYARLYFKNDNKKTAYLDKLSVSLEHRNQGIGLDLQITRENIARNMGYEYCMLWTKKHAWMREWYKRRGYKFDSEKDNDHIWLKKKL